MEKKRVTRKKRVKAERTTAELTKDTMKKIRMLGILLSKADDLQKELIKDLDK